MDKYCVIVGVHFEGKMTGFFPRDIYYSKQEMKDNIDKYSEDYIKIIDKDFNDVTWKFRD